VTTRVNQIRAENGEAALEWNDVLQDLAEDPAGGIVKGAPVDEIDDSLAAQLGEPVAELRACMDDSITTPDAVAQLAVEHWMARPDLREALLDRWLRIGIGFEWGCPDPRGRGVVLVVLLAGMVELREG